MSSLDSTIPLNTTLVHPPFFFIRGLHNAPYAKYYYVFLCFVFVVSVLGNSFVMFIISTESSLHTPKYMTVFNLAIADLGASTALLPNLGATFLSDSQYISFDACMSNMFFVLYFRKIQCVILTIMAYDRMVAICLPLRYHAIVTIAAMAVILTVGWAFTALFYILVVVLITRLSFCKSVVVKGIYCDHGAIFRMACNDNLPNFIMAVIWEILFMYLPLLLTILSYVFIARALFKIASWEGRFKAMKTCSAHLMLVALYYLPYIGCFFASLAHRVHPNTWNINLSLSFAMSSMLDPIIYVLNTEEVKEFSKKKLKRNKKSAPEINKKIIN